MIDSALRATSFGSVARAYERYRPGYADTVVDLALAGLGPRSAVTGGPLRVLECGAGTGKATRVFISRAMDLTVVEPDPQMRAVLHDVVPQPPAPERVRLVGSTLEQLPAELLSPPYDLVYAAASWHWVDGATRWERAAALLRPGGVFASFGGGINPADVALTQAVERFRPDVPHAKAGGPEATGAGQERMRWPGSDLLVTPYFTDVEEHPLPVTCEWPADDYIGLLSTISAFLIIPPAERDERLEEIRRLLPDPVPVLHDVVLHRAVRTGVPVQWPAAQTGLGIPAGRLLSRNA